MLKGHDNVLVGVNYYTRAVEFPLMLGLKTRIARLYISVIAHYSYIYYVIYDDIQSS